jgi:3-dehydroquinate synthase
MSTDFSHCHLTDVPHGQSTCPIYLADGLLSQFELWSPHLSGQVLVVTEDQVAKHHLKVLTDTLARWPKVDVLILPAGEATKSIEHWSVILDRLVQLKAQRDATIIALGGGVIGDLAGFAAASYMRGIRLIQMPTSLLAQVDAAIGGKTGINHPMGKNLIGAFHAPHAVIIDARTLVTLPDRDYRAGLAEVIKYGAIGDRDFFEWLEKHSTQLTQRQPETLTIAIGRSVQSKREIVARDERESGERALLNFGHTFGHAIEAITGYDTYRHGEAVAIGMVLASALSESLGLAPKGTRQRLQHLIESVGLPSSLPVALEPDAMLERMRLDKKNRDNSIRLVLLNEIGQATVAPVEESQIMGAFERQV